MHRFKVGQTVKIIADQTLWHGFKVGAIGKILKIDVKHTKYGNLYRVRVGKFLTQLVSENQLEVVLDLTKPVFTAEGTPVQIVSTQGRDQKFPVLAYEGKATQLSKYSLDGKRKGGAARRFLTNVQVAAPKPDERVFYVNLYDGTTSHNIVGYDLHNTVGAATEAFNKAKAVHGSAQERRVGIAKVTLVEGRLPKSKGGK